jgi:protein SCO1/2
MRPPVPLRRRRRIGIPRRVLTTLGVAALGACGGADAPFAGIAIDPPRPAPPLVVMRSDGGRFDLAAERGRAVLLFFGYTHCPDICPTTLADWARLRRILGDRAERVRFVFVSVDPARDTPAVADGYATQFDRTFIGLSPDSLDLPAIQMGFGVTATREAAQAPGEYLVAHASQAFLVAPDGQLRLVYPFGAPIEGVARDLERLLR